MHSLPWFCFKQATLKVRGKALSTEQKAKVVDKRQTENPLYLKILLEVSALFATSYIFLVLIVLELSNDFSFRSVN